MNLADCKERLHSSFLLLALQTADGLELRLELLAFALNLVGIVSCHSDHSSDTLGDRTFFGDDEILDDISLLNVPNVISTAVASNLTIDAYVPPQNSILTFLHFVSSIFSWISSSG